LAPSNFGDFSSDLLVGNFGDGTIHAYDPTTGALKGTLSSSKGHPLVTEGLWGLAFGNGTTAGDTNTLFFTAGPDDEEHGLIGNITANPQGTSPISATLHDGTLTVLGSRGNDDIDVSSKHNTIEVTAGSKKIGVFDPSSVSTIEIFGVEGNDRISVSSKIKIRTLIDGGEGNDRLSGGDGPTALVGGVGADLLFAGAGRSVLIGGTGHDVVKADRGGAIVIGGSTAHDTDSAALLQILNEWSSGDSLAVRQEKLQTGADGLPPLNDTTVVDDGALDTLFARHGENWTFRGVHDIVI
jgi:Ca2+-binding RTX toxin-like protein